MQRQWQGIVISTVAPWPVRGGLHSKLAGLLEHAPPGVRLICPEPTSAPGDTKVYVIPQASRSAQFRSLACGHLPSQARLDGPAILRCLAEIAADAEHVHVHCDSIGTAHLIPAIRRWARRSRQSITIVCSINDSYSFLRAENPRRGPLANALEVRFAKRNEARFLDQADLVDVVAAPDVGWLAQVIPSARVRIMPLGVRHEFSALSKVKRIDLLMFSGNAGARDFLESGLDRLRKVRPNISVKMVGPQPSNALVNLLVHHRIEYLGFVDDIAEVVASARVLLAPSQQRCGMSSRALLGFAAGTAVVGGRCLQSIPGSVSGKHFLIGFDGAAIADQVLRVLREPEAEESLVTAARHLVESLPTAAEIASTYWLEAGARIHEER